MLASTLNKLKRYWYILVIILLSIILLSQVKSCKKEELFTLPTEFQLKMTKDSLLIAEQKQLLVEKNNEIVKGIKEIEKLKSLKSQVKYITKTEVKEILVPYKDSSTIITYIDTIKGDTANYLKLPAQASTWNADSSLNVNLTVDTNGVTLNNIIITDTTTVTIGTPKGWFKSPIVRVKHTSPYIQTQGMTNVVVDDKVAKKQAIIFGVGFGAGTALTITAALLGIFLTK